MKTLDYLAHVAACIRVNGYVSKGKAKRRGEVATAVIAEDVLTRGLDAGDFTDTLSYAVTDKDRARAEDALQAGREYLKMKGRKGDYELKLLDSIAGDELTRRDLGLAASLYGYLQREREAARKAAESTSTHVGTVGERIELDARVTFTKEIAGYYGETMLVKLESADGNELVTFSSGRAVRDLAKGDSVRVRGTVKDHDSYKGVPQTKLSRIHLVEKYDAVESAKEVA